MFSMKMDGGAIPIPGKYPAFGMIVMALLYQKLALVGKGG
jgi:hypothetical protein